MTVQTTWSVANIMPVNPVLNTAAFVVRPTEATGEAGARIHAEPIETLTARAMIEAVYGELRILATFEAATLSVIIQRATYWVNGNNYLKKPVRVQARIVALRETAKFAIFQVVDEDPPFRSYATSGGVRRVAFCQARIVA